MARFCVSVAANKHRKYVDFTAELAWQPILAELRAHNALVSNDAVIALRNLVLSVDYAKPVQRMTYGWLFNTSCFSPFRSLPAWNSSIFSCIAACSRLDLVENLQPHSFDRNLRLRRSGDEPAQFALLLLASETATPISASARRLVVELFDISSDRVRAQAIGVIARLCEPLVAAVARMAGVHGRACGMTSHAMELVYLPQPMIVISLTRLTVCPHETTVWRHECGMKLARTGNHRSNRPLHPARSGAHR